ncbi:hypothetical protein ACVWXO_005426 [Bradyrhizobium sp. LM2.7]
MPRTDCDPVASASRSGVGAGSQKRTRTIRRLIDSLGRDWDESEDAYESRYQFDRAAPAIALSSVDAKVSSEPDPNLEVIEEYHAAAALFAAEDDYTAHDKRLLTRIGQADGVDIGGRLAFTWANAAPPAAADL